MRKTSGLTLLTLALLLASILCPKTVASEPEGESHLSSGLLTNGNLFNIGTLVGANAYYNQGITGQNTKSTVLEAGLVWTGHETLSHVTNQIFSSATFGGTNPVSKYDRHATWVAGALGGRATTTNTTLQNGIAYGTDLQSASLSTAWTGSAYSLNFSWSQGSWTYAMTNSWAQSDVINQSYGFVDPAGTNSYTRMGDAFAVLNRTTLSVVSAGNSGPGANTVGSPGSGYNTLTVGATGPANTYDVIASFSSRGPQDWGYRQWLGGITYSNVSVAGVRAAIDLSAPGSSIRMAFYGGQTGGNNTNLAGSVDGGGGNDSYSSASGTSFASPIVAGGAALLMSAAKTLPELQGNSEARQSVVVKALLMNGADKLSGWNNGQSTNAGVVTTTQSLDYALGTGSMNLSTTWTNQMLGQRGVTGTGQGSQGIVGSTGWDLGASLLNQTNSYMLSGLFTTSSMTATLTWLREVQTVVSNVINGVDIAQANLDLEVWALNPDGSLGNQVGVSRSFYNNSEHLHFNLPNNGYYAIGVTYSNNSFDNFNSWGTGANKQQYGLAWLSRTNQNWESVYWQDQSLGNLWTTNQAAVSLSPNAWNGTVGGSATNAYIGYTAPTVKAGFHGNFSSPILIDGTQSTRGLSLAPSNSALNLAGTNAATLRTGRDGMTMEAGATAKASLAGNVTVNLGTNQTWRNSSSQDLEILGTVNGSGDLTIRPDNQTSKVLLSGAIIHTGRLENEGAGQTTLAGNSGSGVSRIAQNGSGELVLATGTSHQTPLLLANSGLSTLNGTVGTNSLTTLSSGASLRGSGTAGSGNLNAGSVISPGFGVGSLEFTGILTLNPTANYNWQLYDATTTWDQISLTGSGALDLALLSLENRFSINLWTVTSTQAESFETPLEYSGLASNFNANQSYSWTIISSQTTISGFDEDLFWINASANVGAGSGGFANTYNAGGFSLGLTQNGMGIALNYTPVPEPASLAAAAGLITLLAASSLLKKKKSP
jgi:hypothetical protein